MQSILGGNRYVKADGQEKVDTYSGRPGHSEHQTGLAVDVYNQKVLVIISDGLFNPAQNSSFYNKSSEAMTD